MVLKKIVFVVMLLLAFNFLAGCSSQTGGPSLPSISGPPQGAVDAVIADVHAPDRMQPCGSVLECKDFQTYCSIHMEVTPAEKANGIEDKWCIGVSYIGKRGSETTWKDYKWDRITTNQAGSWNLEGFCNYQCSQQRR